MDELEFRRTLYADPNSTDERVLAAIADDPKKQAFCKELKQLDKSKNKCKVEVNINLRLNKGWLKIIFNFK